MNRANLHSFNLMNKSQTVRVAGKQIIVVEVFLDFLSHLIGRIIRKSDHHNTACHFFHCTALRMAYVCNPGYHRMCFACSSTGSHNCIFLNSTMLYSVLFNVKAAVLVSKLQHPFLFYRICLTVEYGKISHGRFHLRNTICGTIEHSITVFSA